MKKELLINIQELRERQNFSLDEKIKWTIERYLDFLDIYHKEGVYLSFSGGKDSHTLADIIERLHSGEFEIYLEKEYRYFYVAYVKCKPSPPKVFADTGLEFPEIRKHVRKFENVTWLKPKTLWREVVEKYGFLIGGKKVSRMINDVRNPTKNNEASRTLYLTGIKRDGSKSKNFLIPKRWRKLIDAPFNISQKCCDIFKKEPFKRYEKETGRKPISGTTAEESDMRRISYLQTGCNTFGEDAISRPFSIWREVDVWAYSNRFQIRFAEVYYAREIDFVEDDGMIRKVTVVAEKRTGCMFCLIGTPNQIQERFDRLSITHTKQYNFLMDTVGIRKVFEWIGIKKKTQTKLF